MSKFIAWLKSLFSKGKAEMTDLVASAETVASDVESISAGVASAVLANIATATIDDAAAKIKAIYDKLGVDLHAWDEVVALAKAL